MHQTIENIHGSTIVRKEEESNPLLESAIDQARRDILLNKAGSPSSDLSHLNFAPARSPTSKMGPMLKTATKNSLQ